MKKLWLVSWWDVIDAKWYDVIVNEETPTDAAHSFIKFWAEIGWLVGSVTEIPAIIAVSEVAHGDS